MAEGIYTPDGTLIPFSRADLGTELATRQNAGVFFGELDGWLNALPDPDPVLRKRGDDAAILRELSADDQVTTAMLSRKNRVLNCPHFSFRAGAPEGETPMPEAEELHRRFMRDLERTNLRTIISGMLDAPFYGFTSLSGGVGTTGGIWWTSWPGPTTGSASTAGTIRCLWGNTGCSARTRAPCLPASLFLYSITPPMIIPTVCGF